MTKSSNLACNSKRPVYLFPLLGLTLLYLLLECAFNAQLLDVAGGNVSADAIEHIEFWGRLISGTAFALAICGSCIFPWLYRRNGGFVEYAGLGIMLSIPLILFVFHGQKILIDTLVERSTIEDRRIATLLAAASSQLRHGELLIDGFDLDTEALQSPSGKSFVALFSALVSHLPNTERIVMRELDSIVRQTVIQEMGSAEALYQGPFRESFIPLQKEFDRYVKGVAKYKKAEQLIHSAYKKAIQGIQINANKTWNEYVQTLKDRNITPSKSSSRVLKRICAEVQKRGIPVPNNWHPSDQKIFLMAYKVKAQKAIDRKRNNAFVKLGSKKDLQLGITSFAKFLQHKPVQNEWKKALHLPASAKLKHNMTLREFEKYAFIPLREHLIAEQKKVLRSKAELFGKGKKFEGLGKDAMRAFIVPPIALFFSLLGAIIHLCKTGFYLLRLILPSPFIAMGVNISMFVFLLVFPMYLANPITNTDVYAVVEGRIVKEHPHIAKTMRWIIEAQTFAYPANAWIRDEVLQGINFGVEAKLSP